MATSGTLIVHADVLDKEEKNDVPIYRCCDFFEDEMKELIESTFKDWHTKLTEGYEEHQCTPIMIASAIFATKWNKMKVGQSFHMCISLYDLCSSGGMVLNITDAYRWILEYTDWDDDDNEITIREELTKNGWKVVSLHEK